MSDVTILKEQRDHLIHELDLAARYPHLNPYRDPAHVQGLRDELATLDAELDAQYQAIQTGMLAKAHVRSVNPDGREAVDKAAAALEAATAEAEASIREHAVKVREAARERYQAELTAGDSARYPVIWNQSRNRLVKADQVAYEN